MVLSTMFSFVNFKYLGKKNTFIVFKVSAKYQVMQLQWRGVPFVGGILVMY